MLSYEVGSEIKVDIFKKGDIVDVTGTSKGKATLVSLNAMASNLEMPPTVLVITAELVLQASVGRIQRVIPEQNAWTSWSAKTTVLNLLVVDVLPEKNALLIKGAIPGPKYGILKVRSAVKSNYANAKLKT